MMTMREMLEAVIAGTVNEDVIETAAYKLAQMDKENEARKNRMTEKKVAHIELANQVGALFGEEPLTASDIAAALGISVQKASSVARKAVELGLGTQVDVKVKGKGTQKGYVKAQFS